jgi:predicted kinase
MTGSAETTLIVLRGNSASGKSSVAEAIRQRHGRGMAIVGQDYLRRNLLWEKDRPGAAIVDLIDTVARFALDRGFNVVVEGILYADHYGEMLTRLGDDHAGSTHFFYFDVSFEETSRRHLTKPQAVEYGEQEMREWYRPLDLLPQVTEHLIPEATTQDEAVDMVMRIAGLRARE